MSWASRRRTGYAFGVLIVIAALIGIPVYFWLHEPATCSDGKQNQGETAVDKGGPCLILDERALLPHAILWSRSFEIRKGFYGAVAYIENPNKEAGVAKAHYRFSLYDDKNLLVTVREGTTFINPDGTTPVFEGNIDTGTRTVARTYFEFTEPLVWEVKRAVTKDLSITNKQMTNTGEKPRLTASVKNTAVADLSDISFVAVIFDTAGNAFAASKTYLDTLTPNQTSTITFTWPEAFRYAVSRIDILPLLPPESPRGVR